MSFSKRILIGLGAGVAVGVFLGERAAALEWLADGFVKLLQMTVLPQMTVSIVGGLGTGIAWIVVTVVSKSSTSCEIATFITAWSRTIRN